MSKMRSSKAFSPGQLAKEVNRIDRDLVKLMNERAKIARQLAALAPEAGEEIRVDEQSGSDAVGSSRGPLDERALRSMFRELDVAWP